MAIEVFLRAKYRGIHRGRLRRVIYVSNCKIIIGRAIIYLIRGSYRYFVHGVQLDLAPGCCSSQEAFPLGH